jgi:predicted nucleic acid-binding protein
MSVETKHPTCAEEGYTTYTCVKCGYSYTDQYLPAHGYHVYEDGKCINCGQAKPVVKPTLTVTSIGLSLKDEVIYNVYFTAGDVSDVVEMGLLGFNTQNESGTISNADYITPGYTTSGQYYIVHSNGISAKNLSDNYYYKVYAKLSDGTYVYSSMKSYNAVKYANTILGNASSNAKLKAAVVAMLNYGAAAQVQFDYKTDALMNAGLTAEQKALVKDYDASMISPIETVDSNKAGEFATKYASARSVSISLKGAFAINYYLTASKAVDSGMTLYYWTEADYKAATKLTTANATGSVVMDATGTANQFKAAVEGISAKQIDETIFVVGVYESNGVTYSTGVLAYSLGKYCEQQAAGSNAALAAMAQATAVYGYYAKAYFGN